MKTHKWLLRADTRTGGSVRGGRGKHSKQATRVWVTRGILATALAFGGAGAVGAALSAHDGAGHGLTRQTSHASLSVVTTPAIPPARTSGVAWMY